MNRKIAGFLLASVLLGINALALAETDTKQKMAPILTQALDGEARINDDPTATAQTTPVLAMNSAGFVVACWEDGRENRPGIFAQRVNSRGLPNQANFKIPPNAKPSDQFHPGVAVDATGRFVVVWEEKTSTVDIFARLYGANAAALSPTIRVTEHSNTYQNLQPAVAMNSKGDFIICWVDKSSEVYGDIYAQRFSPAGEKTGGNFRVNSDSNYLQDSPHVAMHDDGSFVIAWEDGRDFNRPSQLYAIYAQNYAASGAALGGNIRVSQHPGGTTRPLAPTVAMHSDKRFLVCWSYGSPADIYAHLFDAAGSTLKTDFIISALGAFEPAGPNERPQVRMVPYGGYGVAWDSNRGAGSDVYFRAIDGNGGLTGSPIRLNELVGLHQTMADWGMSSRGTLVSIWQDDRNGNPDIFGTWRGLDVPQNVVAAGGCPGRVPISWDPPYGRDNITRYRVERSDSDAAPFAPIAVIDLTARGALGATMRDFVDTGVTNGQKYRYAIIAEFEESDGPSVFVSATPSAGGHQLSSEWTSTAPNIDGDLLESEWSDAQALDISTPGAPSPITLLVKNDADYLYLAVDDPNDRLLDNANGLTFLIDANDDGHWPASGPSNEGILQITGTTATFLGAWGAYPDHLGADAPRPAGGITRVFSTASGHVQYELRLDLHSSPISCEPGTRIGLAIAVIDPNRIYPTHYGNAGEWPYGALWEAAESVGQLTLAEQPYIISKLFAVGNTLPSGPGSLRQALMDAASASGQKTIEFRIPTTDPGYRADQGIWVIQINETGLFPIDDSTLVDGASQRAFIGSDTNPYGPEIIVESTVTAMNVGFAVFGQHNEIRDLIVHGFGTQVLIYGDANKINSCYFGTDAQGNGRRGADNAGIVIMGGSMNLIGSLETAGRNVICGQKSNGIYLYTNATNNHIMGNYVGLNASASDTLGGVYGISLVDNCRRNIIGPGNVISGHEQGIYISNCDSTRVVGNLIGTDPSGTRIFGNRYEGISVVTGATHTIIGGPEPEDGNIISGNMDGIQISGTATMYTNVQSNLIGTDISGTLALGNLHSGINISNGASQIQIGDFAPGGGNILAANGSSGISIVGETTHSIDIPGNYIGTNQIGSTSLGNGRDGIAVRARAYNVGIEQNVIAHNVLTGIFVDTNARQVTASQNSIHHNGSHGIFIDNANDNILPPVLQSTSPVNGTSLPMAAVEIFSGSDDEGMYYEGTVTADASGDFSWPWPGAPTGKNITATATDANGNTSRFSNVISTGISAAESALPQKFVLHPNYPNPFNPSTTFVYDLPEVSQVRLEIYDHLGRKIRTLVNLMKRAGQHQAIWDGHDAQGMPVASGVYHCVIEAAATNSGRTFRAAQKLMLLK